MTEDLPPRDTLQIVGGRRLERVDADAVLAAAGMLDDAAAHLRAAAARCALAQGVLERSLWASDPLGLQLAAGGAWRDPAVRRRAGEFAGDVAARLGERSRRAAALATRLRIAAGLYRRTESAAEQVTGGVVTTVAGLVGLGTGAVLAQPLVRWGAHTVGEVTTWVTRGSGAPPRPVGRDPVPPETRAVTTGGDGPAGALLRTAAPVADEAIAGLGWGVGLVASRRPGVDASVTGAAGALGRLVRDAMPDSALALRPLAADAFPAGEPAWADRPAGTVAEALSRTADLYPHGSGIVGRPGAGAPEGTLAVEEVTHDDGSTSWTVLIPGTQSLVSTTHPFDGLTDLELMAREASEITEAVTRALAEAGAARDEPVVLVGHSLGGIAAVALASSPVFRGRHRVGGVVTAGSPTASFDTPRGVPVLHLENDEELVSPLDGRSTEENPVAPDRVTVGRALGASADPADRAASGSIALAHAMPTHLRTLAAARASGNVQVAGVADRLEALLGGQRARTRFFGVRREAEDQGTVIAPGPDGAGGVSSSSGRTLR